jgi:hypothetical protein
LHLLSTAIVTPICVDNQNRLRAFLSVISLDPFALIRLRSTGEAFLEDIQPFLL